MADTDDTKDPSTCKIPDCAEPGTIDRICGMHAAEIYTRERRRVMHSLEVLLPNATPEQIQALVTQLEHLMQMLARTALAGAHFEMHKVH